MEGQKDYRSLDLIRFISSFFVVTVHVHFPRPYLFASMAAARFAVPVFFMISGFFLYSSGSKETSLLRIKKSIKKTLLLSIATILLYFAVNSIVCLIKGQPVFYWLTSVINAQVVFELLILNNTTFICSMIWYLLAYLYVLAIVYLFVKYDVIKRAFILIPLLLILNILAGEALRLDWYYQGNWLLTGLPFVLAGMYIRERSKTPFHISKLVLWLLIISGTIITIIETLFFNSLLLYTGTILTTAGIFMLGIISEKQWPQAVSVLGRKISLYVYILHCCFRDIYYALFGYPDGVLCYLLPFIIFFVSAMTGYLLYKASQAIKGNKDKKLQVQ